jgi:hypothetical protein
MRIKTIFKLLIALAIAVCFQLTVHAQPLRVHSDFAASRLPDTPVVRHVDADRDQPLFERASVEDESPDGTSFDPLPDAAVWEALATFVLRAKAPCIHHSSVTLNSRSVAILFDRGPPETSL